MEKRLFGKTGMHTSVLGLGCHELNGAAIEDVRRLVATAIENGINVLDTAECYGDSEQLLGESLGSLRENCYLFTKCGHAAGLPLPDWHPSLLEQSIERSLQRLKTDYLDLVLLHSCSRQVLQQGEVIAALQRMRAAGKVRSIGYSGDRAAAHFAIQCGAFDAIELSVNLADQEAIDDLIALATARNLGVIAKRSLANVAWKRDPSSFAAVESHLKVYQERLSVLDYDFLRQGSENDIGMALRFTVSVPGVHVALVGSRQPERIAQNIAQLAAGMLPPAEFEAIRTRWKAVTWWRKALPGGRLGWRGWT